MMTKTVLLITAATLMVSCQSETRQTQTSPATRADPAAEMATKKEMATEPRAEAAKRLNQLDAQIEWWAQMMGGGEKEQTQRRAQAVEMRVEAKRLRDQMGGWEDKGDSGGPILSREVEEGLERMEARMQRLGESAKP